jgi:hypothetical protein
MFLLGEIDMASATDDEADGYISNACLAKIARRHGIEKAAYPHLRKAIDRGQTDGILELVLFGSRKREPRISADGIILRSFISALERAQSLLESHDGLRARLRLADRPTWCRDRERKDSYRTNPNRPSVVYSGIHDGTEPGDILARRYLRELLLIARAGVGDGRKGKGSFKLSLTIPVAVSLLIFWRDVLKRPVQLSKYSARDSDELCAVEQPKHLLDLADDVLNALYPDNPQDFGDYLLHRQKQIKICVQKLDRAAQSYQSEQKLR